MSLRKPVIGVTGPDQGATGAWLFTSLSVWLAGGKAVRITPSAPRSAGELAGLILGGGADVEPTLYGQDLLENLSPDKTKRGIFEWVLSLLFFPVYWIVRYLHSTKSAPIDPNRDELELQLLKESVEQGKPVLGICRGMQLMNVYFKGSLHQNIQSFYSESPKVQSIFPKKEIELLDDSLLAKLLEATECRVNALHNQAIDKPGQSIRIVAREKQSGVFQALEHEQYPFVIGVQWHPEYLIQVKKQRRIFKNLVEMAKKGEIYPFKRNFPG